MQIDFKELKDKVDKITRAGEIEEILQHDTMYNRFKETALQMPSQPAIMYMNRKITYHELLGMIDDASRGLSTLGIKPNDMVTTSLLATPSNIALFYALDKIGATIHLVNSASSMDEIKRELTHIKSKFFVANDLFCSKDKMPILKEAGIETIITTSLLDTLPTGFNFDKTKYMLIEKLKGLSKKDFNKDVINFENLLKIGRNVSEEVEAKPYEPHHIATIAYTSGSTGNSKPCAASWEKLDSMIQVMGMTEQGRFQEGDIMLTTFPLWIYYSLLNMIHEPLCLGVTLALDPLFDPKNLVKRNEQYQFNHWLTIPPYLKSVVESKKNTDCSRWKIVLTGGAELTNNVKLTADKYIARNGGNIKVVQGYGASECLGSFAYCYYPDSTLGSLGKPCIGNMLKILDPETLTEVAQGESGVGYFYSPALMDCYYGDIEATKHNLIPDENGINWYNTEDLLHVNEQGEIFLDGRIRRIALCLDNKKNPAKIIPERTRKELMNLQEIDKCEVITVPDEVTVNKSVACVVLKHGVEQSDSMKQHIIDYSQTSVPLYMAATDVVFLDEMPLNSNNKPDISALETIYHEQTQVNNKNKQKVKTLYKNH